MSITEGISITIAKAYLIWKTHVMTNLVLTETVHRSRTENERSGVVGRKGVCCRAWRMHSANKKEMYNILSEMRSQQLHALWWTETYNVITHYISSLGPSSIAYVPTTKHSDSSNNTILFLTILWKRDWSRDKVTVRIKDNELR